MAGELVDFTDEGTVPKDLDTLAGILSISRQQLDLYISKGLPTDYVHSAINWLVSSEPAWAAEERSEEGYSDDDLARLRAAKQDSDAVRLRIQSAMPEQSQR